MLKQSPQKLIFVMVIVRYCQDHAMCGKERFIGPDCRAITLFRVQSEAAWLNWVVGFIGGAKPWGRERESLVSDYL
jgi:hypothetical protein